MPERSRNRRDRGEGDATGGVIPYKNGMALGAYYCAIFSLIPCVGIPLGIVAVVLGIMGLKKYKENPRVHGAAHAWIGIILGSLTALAYTVLAIIMLVAMVAATHSR